MLTKIADRAHLKPHTIMKCTIYYSVMFRVAVAGLLYTVVFSTVSNNLAHY